MRNVLLSLLGVHESEQIKGDLDKGDGFPREIAAVVSLSAKGSLNRLRSVQCST